MIYQTDRLESVKNLAGEFEPYRTISGNEPSLVTLNKHLLIVYHF